MFEITDVVQGKTITYVETLKYVKVSPNGSYIECERSDAEGIAVNNSFYRLAEIAIKEIDYAKTLFQLNQQVTLLSDCVIELANVISQYSDAKEAEVDPKNDSIANLYLNSIIQGNTNIEDIPNYPSKWKSQIEDLYSQHNLSDEEEEEVTADNSGKRNPTPRRAK